MSVLSGIGQIPSLFSGGGIAFTAPILFTIPLESQGTTAQGDGLQIINIPTNLLESDTTYRMLFCYSAIPDTNNAQYATLTDPSPSLYIAFFSGQEVSSTNIPIDAGTTIGFLSVDGQFTTPNLSLYQTFQITITSGTTAGANWEYPTDVDAELFTAGQIFFEALK
jgi:hypothetical protein